MISLLARKFAEAEHGIVAPSSMVHISTLPLKLAKLNQTKKEEGGPGSGNHRGARIYQSGSAYRALTPSGHNVGPYKNADKLKSHLDDYESDFKLEPKKKEADSGSTQAQVLRSPKESQVRLPKGVKLKESNNSPFRNHIFEVVLIQEGMGNFKDCYFYTKEALQLAASSNLFEGKQAFADHPTEVEEQIQPERSTRDILGYYDNVRYQESQDGVGQLVANMNVANSISLDWAMMLLTNSLDYSTKFKEGDLVGLSINASGSANPTDLDSFMSSGQFSGPITAKLLEAKEQGITQINVVNELTDAQSVDLVTKAGAGGRISKMLEREKAMSLSKNVKKTYQKIQEDGGAGAMPPASMAKKQPSAQAEEGAPMAPGAPAADHADAAQDQALFAKMIQQYLGKDQADPEEMEMAKHSYEAHKEAGMEHHEAYEAAGQHLKMAMAIGKKMAQGNQAQSESEGEAHESEHESESESHEAQSAPPAPKSEGKKKESMQVAQLAGEVAKLRESVKSYEIKDYLESKMKTSGESVAVTKKFREALGTPKSKEQIDSTWNIFIKAFKAGAEEVSEDGALFMEKNAYRESGEKEGSSFSDCLR